MKICNKCGELKKLELFYFKDKDKTRHRNECKSCSSKIKKAYREANKDKIKEQKKIYRRNNSQKIKENKAKNYKLNKEKIKERRLPYFQSEIVKEQARLRASKYYYNNKDLVKDKFKIYREKNKEKISLLNKEYYILNKPFIAEKRKTYSNEWYLKNKERLKMVSMLWRSKNKKRIAEKNKEWALKNKDLINMSTARRRFCKANATPKWANSFFISEAYSLALLRSEVTGYKWQVDHIVPLRSKIVCGLHCESNLQVIPKSQNLSKGNRYWPNMPD